MEDDLLIKVLLGNHWLDDVLFQVSSNLIVGNSLIMLSGNQNSADTNRNHCAIVIVVLNCDLGFAIRSQPWACPILADLGEACTKLSCKYMTERHKLRGLISRIAKHVTLVNRTNLLGALGEVTVNTLSNKCKPRPCSYQHQDRHRQRQIR